MKNNTKPYAQLYYLNNLKILLIVLVVLHHSAEAYTVGESWGIISPIRTVLLRPLLGINSTFFMGLFFLISGFFVPKSFSRYKLGLFIWGKIQRLLIPALFVIAVVLPLTFALFVPYKNFWDFYWHGWWSIKHFDFGHMWFVLQLFIYCIIYSLIRSIWNRPTKPKSAPGHFVLVVFAVILGLATTAVNSIWPINTWFGFHLIEPYHAPQYIMLFIIGLTASRHNWFETISSRVGYIWLGFAVLLMILFIIIFTVVILGHYPPTHPVFFIWWGSFFCTAVCVGLIVLFREVFNKTNYFLTTLSGNSYGVYLFHIPFVFLMNKWLLVWSGPVLVKFALTFLFAYSMSNILVWLVRMTHPMRRFI